MRTAFRFLVLVVIAGCDTSPRQEARNLGDADAAEKTVRAVIAAQFKADAASIPMDKPISEPPLRADDLDLVEIVMELEERHGVEISDDAVERFAGGKLGKVPTRITPNQLAEILRQAPKLRELKKRR